MNVWLATTLFLVLAVACSGVASVPAFKPASDFNFSLYQGQEILGAKNFSLSQLEGKPVIINFWAAQCPPCRVEVPEFQEFYEDNKDRLILIGIDVGEFRNQGGHQDALRFLAEEQITYPAGYPENASIVRDYNIVAIPKTVFITSEGEVFDEWLGMLNKKKLMEITNEMLAHEGRQTTNLGDVHE